MHQSWWRLFVATFHGLLRLYKSRIAWDISADGGLFVATFIAFCASISPALHETSVLMAGYLQLIVPFHHGLYAFISPACVLYRPVGGLFAICRFFPLRPFVPFLSPINYVLHDKAYSMPRAALCLRRLTVVSGTDDIIPHWPHVFCWLDAGIRCSLQHSFLQFTFFPMQVNFTFTL